jgi:hypothetical protein
VTLTSSYLLLPIPPGTAAAVFHPRESFAVVVVVVALVLALVVVLVRRAGTRGGVHFSTVARMRTAASPPTYAAVPGPEKNRPEGGA